MPSCRLRSISIALALALLLAVGAAASNVAPVAYASACAVTPGATPGPGVYTSVSVATTDPTCSSVQVPAGTFVEQVVINHPLTLTGAGQGATIIEYPVNAANPTLYGGADAELAVESGGVTVSNLTLDGASYDCVDTNTCGSSYNEFYGINIGAGGVTINHVTVQNVGSLPHNGNNGTFAHGIGSTGQSTNGQTVIVENSIIQSFSGNGVLAGPYGSTFDFYNNTVIGNSTVAQTGLSGGTNVSGNTFKHFHSAPCSNCVPGGVRATAIATGSGTVSNNTITDSDNGILVSGTQTTTATITGNNFSSVGTGITLAINQSPQTVQNNHMSGVTTGVGWPYYPGVGIAVCEDRHDEITGNTISGAAAYGIAVFAAQTSACTDTGPGWQPTANNSITGNTISGSGGADLYDATQGGGTAGTANSYASNSCSTSQPSALCASSSTGGGPVSQPTAAPHVTASPQGTVTVVTAHATPTAGNVPSGPTPSRAAGGGGFSSLLLFVGLGGVLLLGGAGGIAYYFSKRSRASKQLAYPPAWSDPWRDDAPTDATPWRPVHWDSDQGH